MGVGENMRDIVIFGASQSAQMMRVYIETNSTDRVRGYTADSEYCGFPVFDGLPLVPWPDLERHFAPDRTHLIGPVSYRQMNELRRRKHQEGQQRGYGLASFIHPTLQLHAVNVGEGCIILEQNVIQPYTWIGKGVIIWSGNVIGHHCTIGDYCFLSSQVGIAGATVLGDGCYVSGKVGIAQGLVVGEGCALLNGAMIGRNLPPRTVAKGPETRPMRVSTNRVRRFI